MNQSRWTSPIVWAAVAAQILNLLVIAGVFDEAMSGTIKTFITAGLEVLVAFGVLNNPTDKSGF